VKQILAIFEAYVCRY